MIEKLKKKDIEKAAKIYNKCSLMQNPPKKSSLEETIKKLSADRCLVYKENNKILGLIRYKKDKKIEIKFICSLRKRQGIGKKLIYKLVKMFKNKTINTTVSSRDKRALAFYNSLGFKKYGQYKSKTRKNFILYKIKANSKDILK